jgi:hypothetical protein
MTDDGMKELLFNSAVSLHLPLDEPPGATAFADTSIARRKTACTDPDCPTAGVPGRDNQAASFNALPGHSYDHLTLANSEINGFTDRLTAAAWVKLNSASGDQRIVGAATTSTIDGWGFGTRGAELLFNTFGVKEYVSSGANLQTGRWYHVAAVFDSSGSKTMQFYLDGQPLGAAIADVAPGRPDTSDSLLVGEAWHGIIDDLTILNAALGPAQMSELYYAAPVLHLRFDDAHGATSFTNDANPANPGTCAGAGCPLTGEAIKGQIGLAAQFDGQQNLVTVPDSTDLHLDRFTIGAWIKPSAMQSSDSGDTHHVFRKVDWDAGKDLDLYLTSDQNAHIFWQCQLLYYQADTATPLIKDHWNNVVATYDGNKLSIYLNGVLSGSAPAGGSCPNDKPVYIANNGADPEPWSAFGGALDELSVYNHALTASEIHDMHVYQSGWVEDRESRTLTVDADSPTAEVVVADPPYQANWPAQVLVEAKDATSRVEDVSLCVGGSNCTLAPHCVDKASPSAWCPTFSPTGQGVYSLSARATDRVGHTATSVAKPVYVDDTAPAVSLAAPANGAWHPATEYPGKSNTWTVHFSGAVSDPALSGGVPGSGVPPDGVQVTLYRADGGLVGAGAQTAAVTGGVWALDYLFGDADPSGCYKAVVEAIDQVGRTSGLPDAQVVRHTAVVEQQISVDADPTVASMDWTNVPTGQLGPAATVLGGDATSRPVPVVLTFTGGTNSDKTDLVLTCQHGNEGSWQPYSTVGAPLAAGLIHTWGQDGKPTIHRGSSCQVQLATSASSDDLSGSVTVCGQEVLTWSGGFAPRQDPPSRQTRTPAAAATAARRAYRRPRRACRRSTSPSCRSRPVRRSIMKTQPAGSAAPVYGCRRTAPGRSSSDARPAG